MPRKLKSSALEPAVVQDQISNLVAGAPTALNTLNELAAALGNDANYAATITTALGDKANTASPSLTGTPTAPTAAAGTNTTQIATTAFVISNGVPSGAILLWSGSSASIPSGWLLCDGTSGTPDLRNRFVIGAGSTYAVAATGGSKDAIVVSHSHTASSSVSDPGHYHASTLYDINDHNQGGGYYDGAEANADDHQGTFSFNTDTRTTGISVSTTVNSTGVSGTDANLPPYYALCYIMKA